MGYECSNSHLGIVIRNTQDPRPLPRPLRDPLLPFAVPLPSWPTWFAIYLMFSYYLFTLNGPDCGPDYCHTLMLGHTEDLDSGLNNA